MEHPTVCSCIFSMLSSLSVEIRGWRQELILVFFYPPLTNIQRLLGFSLGHKTKLNFLFLLWIFQRWIRNLSYRQIYKIECSLGSSDYLPSFSLNFFWFCSQVYAVFICNIGYLLWHLQWFLLTYPWISSLKSSSDTFLLFSKCYF